MEAEIVVKMVVSLIGWGGFIIVLCMLRSFLCFAISIGAAQVLKGASEPIQERMLKWFANADEILEELKRSNDKVSNERHT
jgi:hypothetical protein